MRWSITPAVGLFVASSLASPLKNGKVKARAAVIEERLAGVKEVFQFSWDGYKKYAFPNDELHPVSNSFGNSRNGWGASAVDALSTALLLGLNDVAKEIVDYIPTINYNVTSDEVSLFETTIRYLGGMISGYDLLKGPFANVIEDQSKVDKLLEQSVNLANIMKFAFDTPSGVPRNNLNITNRSTDNSQTNGLAVTGTLVMEWTRLSDLTGNPEYAALVEKAESHLLDPQPKWNEPFPGLVGTNINVNTGAFADATGGWSGGTDSFYEYLIKMFVYDQSKYELYKTRWIAAAESTIAYLTSHPQPKPDLTFVAQYRNKTLDLRSGHLTCFHGGNFILGGEVLGRQDFVDYGLELVEGCHHTYISTATRIGPEGFSWNATNVPANQKEFFDKNGFYITTSYYDLRPEVIESYYYAYRSTGDTKYQDWAWDAFLAINATARATSGFTAVDNVNVVGGGSKYDNQESFWFAEVLKYSYLIQAPDAEWQVINNGVNKWVFNTEAHPFKVKGEPI